MSSVNEAADELRDRMADLEEERDYFQSQMTYWKGEAVKVSSLAFEYRRLLDQGCALTQQEINAASEALNA